MKQIFTLIVLCFSLMSYSGAATRTSSTNNPEFARGPIKSFLSWFQAGGDYLNPLVITPTPSDLVLSVEGTGELDVSITGNTSINDWLSVYLINSSTNDTVDSKFIPVLKGAINANTTFSNLNSGIAYKITAETFGAGIQSAKNYTFKLVAPITLNLSFSERKKACFGQSNGGFLIDPGTDAVRPVNYILVTADGKNDTIKNDTISLVTGLAANVYNLYATDDDGNVGSILGFRVFSNPQMFISLTSKQDAKGCNNGTIVVSGSGGSNDLSYSISGCSYNLAKATGNFIDLQPCPITSGGYTIKAIDNLNTQCSVSTTPIAIDQTIIPVLSASETHTLINCKGAATGKITITATGGSPAYTYKLTKAGVTIAPDIANPNEYSTLLAGTYIATVTDANNCIVNLPAINITEPALPITIKYTKEDVLTCGNGSINANVEGGTITAPAVDYTFSLSPVVGTVDNSIVKKRKYDGLTAQNYTLTVTDSKGCMEDTVIAILPPAGTPLSVTVDTTYLSCNNGVTIDGTATLQGIGGNTSHSPANEYKYAYTPLGGTPASYSPSFTTAPFLVSPLNVGNYTAWVQDGNGCTSSTDFTIAAFNPLVLTLTPKDVTGCNGASNGEITATVLGGYFAINGKVSYSISPGNNHTGDANGKYTGLTAGTYTVTATDSKNCTDSKNVTVTQPSKIVITPPTTTTTKCHGTATGTIPVTASGGNGSALSYTIRQLPAIPYIAGKFSGVPAGTYSIIVSDGVCSDSVTNVKVNDAPLLVLTTGTATNVKCFGDNTGSIPASAIGGTGAYTFSISPNVGTQDTPFTQFSFLPANTTPGYVITVVDGNNCSKSSAAIKVTQPAKGINFKSIVRNNVLTCPGDTTGSIVVTAQDGTPPYTFTLSPKAVALTGNPSVTFKDLGAGNNYAIHLVDAAGCAAPSDSTGIIVTEPAAIVVDTINSTQPLCYGASNGTLTLTAKQSGVTVMGTFTLTGTKGAPSQVKTSTTVAGVTFNVAADTYTVSFKSTLNGCLANNTFILNKQPSKIVITPPSTTATTCHGSATGTITVTASGGKTGSTLTYVLRQKPAIPYIAGKFSTVPAGTYSIIVSDGSCSDSVTNVKVADAALISIVVDSVINVRCKGDNTGKIYAKATGGSGSYTFSIIPNVGTKDSPFTNFSQLTANSPGYTIRVTDASNPTCTHDTTNIKVSEPAKGLGRTVTITNISSCAGDSKGKIVVTGKDGTAPYTVTLTKSGVNIPATSIIQPATTFDLLSAGNNIYSIHIEDAVKCPVTPDTVVSITEPAAIIVDTVAGAVKGPKCINGNDGTITLTATRSGAAIAGTFTITDSKGVAQPPKTLILPATTVAFSGLPAETYSVAFRSSASSCNASMTNIVLKNPTSLVIDSVVLVEPKCNGGADGTITAYAHGGTSPITYKLGAKTQIGSGLFNGLSKNSYTLTITDANSCATSPASQTVILNEPNKIAIVTATASPIVCASAPNSGSILVQVNGGTPPYTFTLKQGVSTVSSNTSGSFTGLAKNDYTVSVTDKYNCTSAVTGTLTVGDTAEFNFTYTSKQAKCFGDGSEIHITPSVVSSSLEYSYDGGTKWHAQKDSVGMTDKTYTMVMRTKDNLCVSPLPHPTVTFATNAKVDVSPVITDVAGCFGDKTGSISLLTTKGGTGAGTYKYTYAADTTGKFVSLLPAETYSSLAGGVYKVWAKDKNGCFDTATVKVNQPAQLVAGRAVQQIDATHPKGFIRITSANPGSSFSVYPVATPKPVVFDNTLPTTYDLTAGFYVVEITDGTCTEQDTVQIYNSLNATVTVTPAKCKNAVDGTISVTPIDGKSSYTYELKQGATTLESKVQANNSKFTFSTLLAAGTYTVNVTDGSTPSLFFTQDVVVSEPDSVKITGITIAPIACGSTAGTITVTSVTGGDGNYTYSRNSVVNSNTPSTVFVSIPLGISKITVVDGAGCKSDTSYVTMTSASAITISHSNIKADDGTPNGSFTASANGGVGVNYDFELDNSGTWLTKGAKTYDFTGLATGKHTVKARNNGCVSAVDTVDIPYLYNSFTADVTSTPNACKGDANAQIHISFTDVTAKAPYNVTVKKASVAVPVFAQMVYTNDTIITNLTEGVYTIDIDDSSKPTAKHFKGGVTIVDNPALSFSSFTVSSPICHEDLTGTITVSVPSAISYTIGAVTQASGSFTVPVGNHTVMATDGSCTISKDTVVTATPRIIVTAVGNDATKTITADVTSPVGVYDYKIAPGAAAFTPVKTWSGLSVGIPYTVYAKNAITGCIDSAAVVTLKNTGPVVIVTDSVCGNDSTGTANVSINFGKPLYSYSFKYSSVKDGSYVIYKNPSFSYKNQLLLTGFKAGYYIISIRSGDAIDVVDTFYIHSKKIIVTPTADGDKMSIKIHAEGGSKPYTYKLKYIKLNMSTPYGTDSVFNGLIKGDYMAYASDKAGCTDSAFIRLEPTKLKVVVKADTVCKGNKGNASFAISNGSVPYSFKVWLPTDTFVNTVLYRQDTTLTNLNAGVYHYRLFDEVNDLERIDSFTIVETKIVIDTVFNSKAMTLTINASGGKAPYQYSLDGKVWSLNNVFAVKMQTYNLHVLDTRGCTDSLEVNLKGVLKVKYDLVKDTICKNALNGDVKITAFGTPDYTLSFTYNSDAPVEGITFADEGFEFPNMIEGTYKFHLEDAAGRSNDTTINIVASNLKINTPVADARAKTIMIHATGGSIPYEYGLDNWSIQNNPKTDSLFTGLSKSNYLAHVMDKYGCRDSVEVPLVNPRLSVEVTMLVDTICLNGIGGKFSVRPREGKAPFSMTLTPSAAAVFDANFDISTEVSNITVGSYSLNVTDADGLVFDTTISINPYEPQVDIETLTDLSILNINGCGSEKTGKIVMLVTGGRVAKSGLYDYSWDVTPGEFTTKDTVTLDKVTAGLYQLAVSDSLCTYYKTEVISSTYPMISIKKDEANSDSALCNKPGQLAIKINGGTPRKNKPYYGTEWYKITDRKVDLLGVITYTIENLPQYQNDTIAKNIDAGGYLVHVTDSFCSYRSDSIGVPQRNNMRIELKGYRNDTIPLTITGKDTVCYEEKLTIIAKAMAGTDTLKTGVNYQWVWPILANQRVIYDGGDTTVVLATNDPPKYRMIAKKSDICYVDSTVYIQAYPNPIVLLPQAIMIGKDALPYQMPIPIDTSNIKGPFEYNWVATENGSEVSALDNLLASQPYFSLANPSSKEYKISAVVYYGKKIPLLSSQQCAIRVSTILTLSGGVDPQTIGNNVLTPNDDGYNDFWRIINAEYYPSIHVEIFNRWGQKVYSETGYNNNTKVWRGNYNGARLPSGVYYYVITLNSKAKALTGTVSIIR